MLELISAVLVIVVIDLVLSGDNAVVIGMAASRLPSAQRRKAIIWGGAGAIGLRIVFTIMAALLLHVPLLQASGAVLLLWISLKLLKPATEEHDIAPAGNFRDAIKTIIMADVVMSLDNILAVGGAARGNIWLLLFGLALSIPILLFFSSLIASMIHRFPVLNFIGSGILVITAMRMFFEDRIIHENVDISLVGEILISAAVVIVILGAGFWMQRRTRQAIIETAEAPSSERRETVAEQTGSSLND